MTARPPEPPAPEDRTARRVAALRENLKRRKAQARARGAAADTGAPAAPETLPISGVSTLDADGQC